MTAPVGSRFAAGVDQTFRSELNALLLTRVAARLATTNELVRSISR